jgi:hypothetical protein
VIGATGALLETAAISWADEVGSNSGAVLTTETGRRAVTGSRSCRPPPDNPLRKRKAGYYPNISEVGIANLFLSPLIANPLIYF